LAKQSWALLKFENGAGVEATLARPNDIVKLAEQSSSKQEKHKINWVANSKNGESPHGGSRSWSPLHISYLILFHIYATSIS
jgi:hypothetical protein